MPDRRQMIALLAAAAASPGAAFAQGSDGPVGWAIRQIFAYTEPSWTEGIATLEAHKGMDTVSSLILALRFSPQPKDRFIALLKEITGADGEDWFDWMLWQEENPVPSHPTYYDMKKRLFLSIDERWTVFLKPEFIAPGGMDIRFEEIAWGGVRRDGIPSLDNPLLIDAGEASYLRDEDLVFGVSINGDARAYPLRIMGWHEMFNDVIGGVPVALAYCTLCGAGILFETNVEGFDAPLVMGTSGFLYRSNKLMYDRTTESLWNQFTGEPVSGALRGSGIALRQRPVAIEPWGAWRERNPETQVLSLDTGHPRDYGPGVVYRDYFASPDLMFPAAAGGPLAKKDYVFGVRAPGGSKAWPLAAFSGGRIINDRVGLTNVVLVGDEAGRTVRAYERDGLEFAAADGGLSAGGAIWRETEDALVAADGRQLPRVAGHVAYWFAWNNYLGPKAELWSE